MRIMGIPQSFISPVSALFSTLVNPILAIGLLRRSRWIRRFAIAWYAFLSLVAALVVSWLCYYHVSVDLANWPDQMISKVMPVFLFVVMLLPPIRRVFMAQPFSGAAGWPGGRVPSRRCIGRVDEVLVVDAIVSDRGVLEPDRRCGRLGLSADVRLGDGSLTGAKVISYGARGLASAQRREIPMSASILIWLMALAAGLPQEGAGSADVVAPGAVLEKVWGEGSFTEGGALDRDGSILFSDIGNRIMRFDPKTGKTTVFREPSGRANGLIFDKRGRLIVAEGANTGGGRRVSITERDGTIRTLADNYDDKRFNSPNDVAVDRDGRVYVSDPRYVGNEPRELDFEGVFLIDLAGVCHPARDHGAQARTAWCSVPTKKRCTSRTTVPGGGC